MTPNNRNEHRIRISSRHWEELGEVCQSMGIESRSKLLELILYQHLPTHKNRYQSTPTEQTINPLVEIIED